MNKESKHGVLLNKPLTGKKINLSSLVASFLPLKMTYRLLRRGLVHTCAVFALLSATQAYAELPDVATCIDPPSLSLIPYALDVRVKNPDGQSFSGVAMVLRYDANWGYLDCRLTAPIGANDVAASWSDVEPGTYKLEVYSLNNEFWASTM